MRWIAAHKMAVLGFAVSAAYWPGMLSAAFTPRWAVIAAGVFFVSSLDPRNIPESLRWTLLFLLAMGGAGFTFFNALNCFC